MDTNELMQVALDLVGFDEIPADSVIYVPGEDIQRVLFGLDIGTGELLLARQLGYDAVIAHHPVGVEHLAWQVFERHVDLLVGAGVPEEAARAAAAHKMEALRVEGQASNYEQVPLAARRLRMPFLNIHCPLDEMGRRVMQKTINDTLAKEPSAALEVVASRLAALGPARRATTDVRILLGDPAAQAGKTVVAHGAYTNGGEHVARAYYRHGVDTVVYIHVSPSAVEKLRHDGEGQLIVTGHLVGDATGIEPYIEALRARDLQVDVLSEVLAEPGW